MTKLNASDASNNDEFGNSVSAGSDRIAVGAYLADEGNHTNSGAAYIFERESNGTWVERTRLLANDVDTGDYFGRRVSLYADRLLVGASNAHNDASATTGAAYLYSRLNQTSWVQEKKFYPIDSNGTGDLYGHELALDGNYSYIGAPHQAFNGMNRMGAVYIYKRLQTGQWVDDVKLIPADGMANDKFGYSIDAVGKSLLIGAPGDSNATHGTVKGKTYWYERDDNGNWNLRAIFRAHDGKLGDAFGRAVAVGSNFFVGAPLRDDRGTGSGATYSYENTNWNDSQPVMSVQGEITVEMDEDGAPVSWSAPVVSATDAGGDPLTWRAYYENDSEANGTVIVSGTGASPQTFLYYPSNNFYGTDTFILEVSDGVYVKTVRVKVNINSQVDDGEPVVRMMPGFGHSSLYANAELGQPITVWGTVHDGEAPYTYSLNYGDGVEHNGTVSDPKFIGSDHVYSTSGLKTATMTVTDSTGKANTAITLVRVFLPSEINLDLRRNMAMEKGLLFLYKNKIEDARMDGFKWYNTNTGNLHTAATTGFAVMAYTDFGHTALTASNLHAYGDMVRKGIRFLVGHENTGTMSIPDHSDGIAVRQSDNPAGKDPGKGAYLLKTGGHDSYSNSIAVMAVLTGFPSGEGATAATIDYGPFTGWNYQELAEELCELIMWTQGDGNVRGGWEYYLNQQQRRHDGSVQQWPVIALMTADEKWGINIPQWVKDNVDHAYAQLTHSNGAVNYTPTSNWLNVDKTGGHLIADAWAGRPATDPIAAPSVGYITNLWMANNGWSDNLYGAYGVKKGLDFIGVKTIQTPQGTRDWDADMSSWYLGIDNGWDPGMNPNKRTTSFSYGQKADGSWEGVFLDSRHNRRYSPSFTTASVLALLSRGVTNFPPIPLVNYPLTVPTNKEFELDGSPSYHSNPAKVIRMWKWKWSWTGDISTIDWNNPDAIGPRPVHPGFTNTGATSFALQVTDNGNPEESVVKEFTISATTGNHAAVPKVIPFARLPVYAGKVGESITLDASTSTDLDQYDSVTGYEWDMLGTGQFVSGNATMELGPFSYPLQGRVGLKVRDETFSTWSDPLYVDVFFSNRDLKVIDLEVQPFNLNDSNFTLSAKVENDAGSVGIARDQIVRFYDGNPFTEGNVLDEAVLPDLPPTGQSLATVTIPISKWTPKVYVLIDPYQRLAEWDEANNLRDFDVIPNYPPHEILLHNTNLLENELAGGLAADLSALDVDDPNATGSYTYNLVIGNGDSDNTSFSVSGTQLLSARPFDFEERSIYYVRMRVTDDKNATFEKELVIPVGNVDDHRPLLFLNGDAALFQEAMIPYVDAGAHWTDANDSSGTVVATGNSTAEGVVNIGIPGTYQLTYNAVDAAGNAAYPIYRQVTVRDTTKPNVFLQGLSSITLEAFSPYSDFGAVWTDTLDGYGTIDANGTIDFSTPGTYTLRYRTVDNAGNISDEITRSVTIIDTSKPVVSLEGNATHYMRVWHTFNEPGATAHDQVDGNLTSQILRTGTVNVEQPGPHILTYGVSDSSGNQAVPVERTVMVYNLPPTDIQLSHNLVEENLPAGTVIGNLSTTDPDDPENTRTYQYSLVTTGEEESLFSVTPEGILKTAMPLNFEGQATHQVRLRTTDQFSGSFEKLFTIEVIDAFLPIVNTGEATNITTKEADLNGSVVDMGGLSGILEVGILYSSSFFEGEGANGVIKLISQAGTGYADFSSQATNLKPGTKYRFKAFARTAEGINYGALEQFKTLPVAEVISWLDGVETEMQDWWTSPWLGTFYAPTTNGWIMHEELGWLYAIPALEDGIWIWRSGMGWNWTSPETFPYLYQSQASSWMYYYGGNRRKILFYHYRDKRWLEDPYGEDLLLEQ